MFLDRSHLQPSRNPRHAVLPPYATQTLPKPRLGIADGLVSVTQQYWATSRYCTGGFAGDAA